MTQSLHAQIRDRLVDQVAQQVTGVIRGRRIPMPQGVDQQVRVYLDQSQPQTDSLGGQPVDCTTRLRIECVARGTDTQTAEDAADALLVRVYAAALADASLGGLVMDLQPVAMVWDGDEASESIAVAQLALQALHRTPFAAIAA